MERVDKRNQLIVCANALLIGGGALVSASTYLSAQASVFSLFLAGHLIWLFHAVRTKDRGVLALNIGMVALDLFAIGIRLDLDRIATRFWTIFG